MEPTEYARLAEVEDRMWYFQGLHGVIEGQLARVLPGGAAVLDAGCGTGGLLRRLAAAHPGWKLTGVDLSPLACALARKRTAAEIREGSVEALPFADGSFEAVVSADVLYHVKDDAVALREAWRVLRPGGILLVNGPAYPWLWSYHDVAVGGLRRYTRDGVRELLQAAGFTAIRASYRNTLVFPLIVARRKLWPAPAGGASDVKAYPAPVEALGRFVLSVENFWLRSRTLLFGSSVFAAARKP